MKILQISEIFLKYFEQITEERTYLYIHIHIKIYINIYADITYYNTNHRLSRVLFRVEVSRINLRNIFENN